MSEQELVMFGKTFNKGYRSLECPTCKRAVIEVSTMIIKGKRIKVCRDCRRKVRKQSSEVLNLMEELNKQDEYSFNIEDVEV